MRAKLRNARKTTSSLSKREFIEAGEDAAKAFESTEEPLDLVAFAIHGLIVLPGLQAIAFRGNHREEAEVQSQLERFVVFVGAIHEQM